MGGITPIGSRAEELGGVGPLPAEVGCYIQEWGIEARRPQEPYCTKGTHSMLVPEVKATHTHIRGSPSQGSCPDINSTDSDLHNPQASCCEVYSSVSCYAHWLGLAGNH